MIGLELHHQTVQLIVQDVHSRANQMREQLIRRAPLHDVRARRSLDAVKRINLPLERRELGGGDAVIRQIIHRVRCGGVNRVRARHHLPGLARNEVRWCVGHLGREFRQRVLGGVRLYRTDDFLARLAERL